MFKKYIKKVSDAVGTVNYMSKQAKERKTNNSSDEDEEISKYKISSASLLALPTAHIIISTAIMELRNTLFFYPLVS